jgi:hypothetical protein
MLAALAQRTLRPVLLFEAGFTSGTIQVFCGTGTLYTSDGRQWVGIPLPVEIGSITDVTKVLAAGTSFTFSGLESALLQKTMQECRITGAAKAYLGLLGADDRLIPDPQLMVWGYLDAPQIEDGGDKATIRFNVEGPFLDNRTRIRRFTNEDQQIDYPGDDRLQVPRAPGQPGDRVGQGRRLERRRRRHRWRARRRRQRRARRVPEVRDEEEESLQTPARKTRLALPPRGHDRRRARPRVRLGRARLLPLPLRRGARHDRRGSRCRLPRPLPLAAHRAADAQERGRRRGHRGSDRAQARPRGSRARLARRGDVVLVDVGTSPAGCYRFELGPGRSRVPRRRRH